MTTICLQFPCAFSCCVQKKEWSPYGLLMKPHGVFVLLAEHHEQVPILPAQGSHVALRQPCEGKLPSLEDVDYVAWTGLNNVLLQHIAANLLAGPSFLFDNLLQTFVQLRWPPKMLLVAITRSMFGCLSNPKPSRVP